ncbi:MAG: HAMP domain-containing histidine kinase [Anaerohalosphaeraceae bacterium]|nr:HAMP domain-containing histidine kinase [Anaerohalosphaeraceae bacterium]
MTVIRKILIVVAKALHLRPMSLAGKCRLLFSIAVLFVISLALLMPYFWMGKLTEKSILDSGNAVVDMVYRRHFHLDGQKSESAALNKNGRSVKWHSLRSEEQDKSKLTTKQTEMIEKLQSQKWLDGDFGWENGRITYVKIVRAGKQCPLPGVSPGQEIGAVIVQMPGEGIRRTVIMNHICLIIAGLLAITGAIVAFYIIAQRLILNPIRQLRAIVNNVSEGNLDVRCGIKSGDEFEKFGNALNDMLDSLLEGQGKLRQANKQLDLRITELSERNIELYKVNKLKGEFLANMSHEFRTPLNAILGFADILKDKPADDVAKSKRYAENIIASGRNLLNMITDLLELAKAEAGKIELHIEKTSVPELCKGLVAFFSPLTEKQKIKVRLNANDEMPIIRTDSGKVQQILYNLLSNAVKFTPDGGKVEIKAFTSDEKTIRISVIDSGPGVSEQDKAKIFEKFRQGDGSITRQQAGTGLGLAISAELAKLLAGEISVEDAEGGGAVFSLDLPIIGIEGDEEVD